MGIGQFDENDAYNIAINIDVAGYSDFMLLFSPLLRPYRIDQIILTSDDTVDHNLTLFISPPESSFAAVGTVLLPAGAGFDPAVPPIDLFPALLASFDHLTLIPGDAPEVVISTAISALKKIYIACFGGRL